MPSGLASRQRRIVPGEGASSGAAQANEGWVSAIRIVRGAPARDAGLHIAINPPSKSLVG
jgi:hypothetical protein